MTKLNKETFHFILRCIFSYGCRYNFVDFFLIESLCIEGEGFVRKSIQSQTQLRGIVHRHNQHWQGACYQYML